MDAAASAANTPPFAATCHASRWPPFSITSPISSVFAERRYSDRALAETKNVTRRIAQLQPAAAQIVPATRAAAAPLDDKAFWRRAMRITMPARTSPTAARSKNGELIATPRPRHPGFDKFKISRPCPG